MNQALLVIDVEVIVFLFCCQGIYYYFYQVFKNKAEAIAAARKQKGRGDGTLGIFSWLLVAALAGYTNSLIPLNYALPI